MPGRGQVSDVTNASDQWQGATAPKQLIRTAGFILSGARGARDTNAPISAEVRLLTAGGKASGMGARVLIGDRSRTKVRNDVSQQPVNASELRKEVVEATRIQKAVDEAKGKLEQSPFNKEIVYLKQVTTALYNKEPKDLDGEPLKNALEDLLKTHNDAVQQDRREAWRTDRAKIYKDNKFLPPGNIV
jgi:hypothetical protein